MPAILPPWPHLLFGILEPLSLYARPKPLSSNFPLVETHTCI